jgi:SAM-dependent methyltransferase
MQKLSTTLIHPLHVACLDIADFFSSAARGKLHLPPRSLRDVGGGDFEATGEEFLGYFVELGSLKPAERVLDIGCGCGRMALPLTRYLQKEGHYVGMDIVRNSIDWCRRHISTRYPNFEFHHADLYNKRYNPRGTHLAQDYTFPLKDRSFDFIFLASVFTHMLPEGVENYFREISRLLDDKGRVFITFFFLNETQRALAERGGNIINFQFGQGVYRIRDAGIPESAVAYDEVYICGLFSRYGLMIKEPILYGTWSGRNDGLSLQDIVIAAKNAQTNP